MINMISLTITEMIILSRYEYLLKMKRFS